MAAKILDGRELSLSIESRLKKRVTPLPQKPCLAMVLVGKHPASEIYLRNKQRVCSRLGIESKIVRLPSSVSVKKLSSQLDKLSQDHSVSALLLQMPLPDLINHSIFSRIAVTKDADCLNPANLGRLFAVAPKDFNLSHFLVPATARGIISLIKSTKVNLKGKKVVVVGRSNLVGKPVSLILSYLGATVTICHSQTKNLSKETNTADILVVAVGKPHLISKSMVNPGGIVIDVGISRLGKRIVGDVDFEQVSETAGWITPVPGGVGPMTVISLMENVVLLAERG